MARPLAADEDFVPLATPAPAAAPARKPRAVRPLAADDEIVPLAPEPVAPEPVGLGDMLFGREDPTGPNNVAGILPSLAETFKAPDFGRLAKNTYENIGADLSQQIAGARTFGAESEAQLLERDLPPENDPYFFLTPEQRAQRIAEARELAGEQTAVGREAAAGAAEAQAPDAGLIERTLQGGLVSGAEAAGALAAGMATGGGAAVAAGVMGAGQGASRYGQLRARGTSEDEATRSAALTAGLESLTEFLPGEALLKKSPGFAGFKAKLAEFFASELPGENITTIGEMVDDYAQGLRDDITGADLAQALSDTTLQTVIGGGMQAGTVQALQEIADRANGAAAERAGDVDDALPPEAPTVPETLALPPPPALQVTPEGVVATEEQHEAYAEQMGLTPDVREVQVRNRARQVLEEAEAATEAARAPQPAAPAEIAPPAVPGLPAPETAAPIAIGDEIAGGAATPVPGQVVPEAAAPLAALSEQMGLPPEAEIAPPPVGPPVAAPTDIAPAPRVRPLAADEEIVPVEPSASADDRLGDLLGAAAKRHAAESQGQEILDGLSDAGTTTHAVAADFWKRTYFNLDATQQRRVQRYLKDLGFKPGDVTHVGPDGTQHTAEDWPQVGQFVSEDLAADPHQLDGIERGFVAMMAYLNEKHGETGGLPQDTRLPGKQGAKRQTNPYYNAPARESAAPTDLEGYDPDAPRVPSTPTASEADLAATRAELDDFMGKPPAKRKTKTADERSDSVLAYLAKKGGINTAEAIAQGLDRADIRTAQGAGIKRPFHKNGMSFDEAAELLDEAGYPVQNADGSYDANKVLDLIAGELKGKKSYSTRNETAGTEAAAAANADRRQGEQRTEDERREEPREGERRGSPRRMAELSHEEAIAELGTDKLTGLKNRRAYEELEQHQPITVAIDGDGLGWINAKMGHEAGDEYLRIIGAVISGQTDHGFHLSGDEFIIEGASTEEAEAVMEAVTDRLANAHVEVTLADGTVATLQGIGISYGLGSDFKNADRQLAQHKTQREAEGSRARKGEAPPNVTLRTGERGPLAAQRREDEDNAPADETEAPDSVDLNEDQGDLFGVAHRSKQALEDARRTKDAKRSGTRDVAADTGKPGDLFTSAKQADIEDVAGKPKKNLPAKQLTVEYNGKRFPVTSLADAQAKWDRVRESADTGVSGMTGKVKIFRGDEQIGTISYNGRLWDMNDKPLRDDEVKQQARGWDKVERGTDARRDSTGTIKRAIGAIYGSAKNAPEVEFVDEPPDELADRMQHSPGRQWAAAFDPVTGRVFLRKGSNTTVEQAVWNAAHEISGHLGLRGLAAKGETGKQARAAIDRVLERAEQNSTVAKLAKAIGARRTALSHLQAVEEAIAELAAATRTGNYAHIKSRYGVAVPATAQKNLKGAIARVVAKIRAWFGARGAKFSDEKVLELLEGMHRYVQEGKPSKRAPRPREGRRSQGTTSERADLAEAHHGSPHRFDEFKLEAIGTGEGAAAYGWGLYFAENPQTAEFYAKQLSDVTIDTLSFGGLPLYKNGEPFNYGPDQSKPVARALGIKNPTDNDLEAIAVLQEAIFIDEWKIRKAFDDGGEKAARVALSELLREHTESDEGAEHRDRVKKHINDMLDKGQAITAKLTQNKHVYTVEIDDKAIETMLEWDAPVGEQRHILKIVNELIGLDDETIDYWKGRIRDEYTGMGYSDDYIDGLVDEYAEFAGYGARGKRVEDELKEIAPDATEEFFDVVERFSVGGIDPKSDTGAQLYRILEGASGDQKLASEQLLKHGIRGISYFDSGSRDQKKGTRNYVVFDAHDVKIKAVNGEKVSPRDSTKIIDNTAEGMDEDVDLNEDDEKTDRGDYSRRMAKQALKDADEAEAAGDTKKAARMRKLAANLGSVYERAYGEPLERDDVAELVEKHGEPITSRNDARRRFETDVIYAIHEQDETPSLVTSLEMLESYTPDQLVAVPHDKVDLAEDVERRGAQRRETNRGGRRGSEVPSQKGDKGYAAAAQRVIDAWNKKVGWRYGAMGKLPGQRAYLDERYRALGRVADAQEIGRKVYDAFKEATPADRQAIYDYLTTRDGDSSAIEDHGLRNVAQKTKNAIDKVGRKLVSIGLLSEEAYQEHAGEYLPRLYLKHVLGDQSFMALGSGKKLSDLGYLKARKDIDEETRKVLLGEITDPAFLASFGLTRTLRDIALVDFLDAVAGREQWVPKGATVEWNGRNVSPFWLAEEARALRRRARLYKEPERVKAMKIADTMDAAVDAATEKLGDVDTREYAQIPNSKRYGALRGLWVRKEIYNDLVGAQNFIPREASAAEWLLGQGGVLTKATQWWKMSKVVLNPPTQVRNFLSNLVLLHLSGVPMRRVYSGEIIGKAINSIAKKDRFYDIAKKYGLFATTFANQEGARIREEWLQLQELDQSGMAKMRAFAGRLVNTASDVYGTMEAIGKIAKLRDAMEREGKSASDAMLEAHETLFDYSLVPRSVQYLRNTPLGSPFITFMYKALGQLTKTAIKHPTRFAPYAAVPYLLASMIEKAFDVDDDDLKKLRKAFPAWMRERGHMLLLPWKDAEGRWQVADMGYLVPWGSFADFAAAAREGKGAKEALNFFAFGGPLTDVTAAIDTNIDPFTGKEIVNPSDPPADKFRAMMQYVWNLAMPGFLTERGALNQFKNSVAGKVNRRGELGQTPAQSALRLFGLNVYPVDPEASKAANLRAMRYELEEARSRGQELLRDRNLTDAERDKIRATWAQILKGDAERIEQYEKDAEIHPNLRTK